METFSSRLAKAIRKNRPLQDESDGGGVLPTWHRQWEKIRTNSPPEFCQNPTVKLCQRNGSCKNNFPSVHRSGMEKGLISALESPFGSQLF
jgi:hypothetical protein